MLYRLSLLSSVHFQTFMTIRRWEWNLMTSRLHRNSDFTPSNLRFRSFTLSSEVLCLQRVERCLCIFEFALINDREFYLLQSSLLSWTNGKVDPILLFLCKIFQIYLFIYLYNYYLSIVSYLSKYFFLVNKRYEDHRTNKHELIVFVVFKQAAKIYTFVGKFVRNTAKICEISEAKYFI